MGGTGLPSVQAVCGYCLRVACDGGEDPAVKRVLFDSLCVSVLAGGDRDALISFLCGPWVDLNVQIPDNIISGGSTTVVKKFYDITQREFKGLNKISSDTLLLLQSCSYRIISIAYDRCSLQQLKTIIAPAYSGIYGPESKGNELTGAVSKAAFKLLRTALPTGDSP